MFLSKFIINQDNPSAKQALNNVQDFHRNLMARFQGSRQEANVLYRIDLSKKMPAVYVLSKDMPQDVRRTDMEMIGIKQMDQIILSMSKGKQFTFDICTIPSKKIACKGEKNSKRITLLSEEERLGWMHRKASQHGFQILLLQELEQVNVYGNHGSNNKMLLKGYHYQGKLLVEDTEKFRQAYCKGIGPDKAYGYGMLLLI